jgi:hypothetical protein
VTARGWWQTLEGRSGGCRQSAGPVLPACCPHQLLCPFSLKHTAQLSHPPENMGSSALMVCVKETATLDREMLVSALPRVCTAARGVMEVACSRKKGGGVGGWGVGLSRSRRARGL